MLDPKDNVMGKKHSKDAKNEATTNQALTNFQDKEVKQVAVFFRINSKTAVGSDKGVFADRWGDNLSNILNDCWTRYIFYESKDHLDKARFAYLYKGQTSLKMDIKAKAIFRVISNTQPKGEILNMSFERLSEYILNIMSSYLRSLWQYNNTEFTSWMRKGATASNRTLKYVNRTMMAPLKDSMSPAGTVDAVALENFLRANRMISDLIDGLLNIAYGFVDVGLTNSVLPSVFPRMTTVLDIAEVIFLESHIMKCWTQHWKLRFHNKGHGSNFTMLCETIVDVGPTLIVVKDTSGYVFGCCASESWKPASVFYGDCRCFLFQLKPQLQYYPASVTNHNFQYHNQNQHMMPNGFGMGGRIGAWGFWLDGDFGKGYSASCCSTFKDYSRLSCTEEFSYDHIEVWSVDEADEMVGGDEDVGSRKRSKSIIENTPGLTNALLKMAGKEAHST